MTSIAKGSREDADMNISIKKTKVLHVRQQEVVSTTTAAEAKTVSKFVCPHLHCGFQFHTRRGVLVHAGRCAWRDEFMVENILDHKGPTCARKYKIRWAGFSADHDTWEPRGNLHPEAIRDYEMANGAYVFTWPHRCDVCNLPCRSSRGIKIHKAKSHKAEKQQDFNKRLADKAVQVKKFIKLQKCRTTIKCEGVPLDNVFKFKYLGSLFAADGGELYDVKARITKAQLRCGQLRSIFDSVDLSLHIKIRLYVAAVCSLLTYGSETWTLCEATARRINGANSIMLARITGNTFRQEVRYELRPTKKHPQEAIPMAWTSPAR